MNHPGRTNCAEPSWGECLHRMARCLSVPVSPGILPDKNKGIMNLLRDLFGRCGVWGDEGWDAIFTAGKWKVKLIDLRTVKMDIPLE